MVHQAVQGVAALQIPGEHLGDDRRFGRVLIDPRGVAGPIGRHPVAVRGAGPGEHLAGFEPALSASPHAFSDQRPLILGDRPSDLEQELVVRVLGHRPVEELDAAAVLLQLLKDEHLMDIVSRQSIRIGDEGLLERGHGRPIAEAVEAGPLERGPAVTVVTEDVPLSERPASGLEMRPQPVDLLFDGLCLGLPPGRYTYIDRDSHRCSPTCGMTARDPT
jgi:hypothetical protein